MLKNKLFAKKSKYNVLVQRCKNHGLKRIKLFEAPVVLNRSRQPSLSACNIQPNPYLDFFNNIGGNYKVEKNEYELLVEMYTEAEKQEYFYKSVRNTKSLLHSYIQGCKAYNFLLSKQEDKILTYELQLELIQEQLYT
ncbi:Hypothetical_protein [Hexamita inflata]|uniref:Hypothetical_protein n=1 Tax=Hexamita inflata TaxID=28002 RepID=A0AA86P6C0_9EUKA|nr:Hypothetical protein HINF_LOCUS19339 [Hexamita inflata]CAI9931698.1 Hypothetical protein HINF_LOCUS19343 [Hexamita inflata]